MINALIPHKISLPKAQRTLGAAQYVRMSTDHQRYSIENQAAVIAAYAQARGLEIVRTYRDDGESGLGIKNRPGLTALIADVRQGRVNFNHILIYDVSRWGRFLKSYARYYNEMRTHMALDKDAPVARPVQRNGVVRSRIILAGLHHNYARA
jgi:predicted site-specific integrase-resolvase